VHAVCSPGQRVVAEPTSSSDRTCTGCAAGAGFSAVENAASCTPVSTCAPGSHVTRTPTPTEDRACAPCSPGTFTDQANLPECETWEVCPPGTHVVAAAGAASATTNRVCTRCEAKTFTGGTNEEACSPLTDCFAGDFVLVGPTPSTDRECAACLPQVQTETQVPCTTSAAPTAAPTPAPDSPSPAPWSPVEDLATESDDGSGGGTVSDDGCGGGATAPARRSLFSTAMNVATCSDHATCVPGEFVAQDATSTSDRICSPCQAGSFSTANNAAACTPVTPCFAGTMVSSNPELYQDRTCVPCPDGAFSNTLNKNECVEWQTCVPGQHVTVEPAASNDRQCGPVRVGIEFTAEENQKSPTLVAHCVAGFFVSAEPTESTDSECSACAEGTFSSAQDASSCSPWVGCDTSTGELYVAAQGTPSSDVACFASSTCVDGEVEFRPPTAIADRICVADPCVGYVCMNEGTCVRTKGESGMTAQCDCADNLDPLICATPCTDSEFVWTPANGTHDTVCGNYPIKLNADGFPDQNDAAVAIDWAAAAAVGGNTKASVGVGAIVGPIVGILVVLLLLVLWRRGVLKQAEEKSSASATLSNFSDQRAGYLNPRYDAAERRGTGEFKRPTGMTAHLTTTNVMYSTGQEFVVPNYEVADPTPGSFGRISGALSNVTYDTVSATTAAAATDRDAGSFANPTYSAVAPANPSAAIFSAMNVDTVLVDAGLGLRRHSQDALYDTADDLEALRAYAAAQPDATYAVAAAAAAADDDGDADVPGADRKDSYLSIQEDDGGNSTTYAVPLVLDENQYDAAASVDNEALYDTAAVTGSASNEALYDTAVVYDNGGASASYAVASASGPPSRPGSVYGGFGGANDDATYDDNDGTSASYAVASASGPLSRPVSVYTGFGGDASAPAAYSVANPSADSVYDSVAGAGDGGEVSRELTAVAGQAAPHDGSPQQRVDSSSSYGGSERRLSLV